MERDIIRYYSGRYFSGSFGGKGKVIHAVMDTFDGGITVDITTFKLKRKKKQTADFQN